MPEEMESFDDAREQWTNASDDEILKAATEYLNEYSPEIQDIILNEAQQRNLIEISHENDYQDDITPPPEHILDKNNLKLPKMWVGIIIAFAFLAGEFYELYNNIAEDTLGPVCLIIALSGISYWYFCVYRIHKILRELSDNQYEISPGAAVGFHFIPFYNLYWIFKWPMTFAAYIKNRQMIRIIPGFLIGAFILISLLLSQVDSALGLFCLFTTGAYIKHKLKLQIECRLARQSGWEFAPPGVWAAGIVLAVLAAVSLTAVIGLYTTESGQAFLADTFAAEEPAETSNPLSITHNKYSLKYPSNWTLDSSSLDYDPDNYFSIDSSGKSAFVEFYIYDFYTDPTEWILDLKNYYVQEVIHDSVEKPFSQWGSYHGAGIELNGKVMLLDSTIRIFIYTSDNISLGIIESYYDEDTHLVQPGFNLIQSTFKLAPLNNNPWNNLQTHANYR